MSDSKSNLRSLPLRRSQRLRSTKNVQENGAIGSRLEPVVVERTKKRKVSGQTTSLGVLKSLSFNCFLFKKQIAASSDGKVAEDEAIFSNPGDPRYLSSLADKTFPIYDSPLATVFTSILEDDQSRILNDVSTIFHIPTVLKLVALIEKHYISSNPYHCSLHAADVTQTLYALFHSPFLHLRGVNLWSLLSPCELVIALLTAAAHDVDHPGCRSDHPYNHGHSCLATEGQKRVNAISPLEHHHIKVFSQLLEESQLLAPFSSDVHDRVSTLISQMILATDSRQTGPFLAHRKNCDDFDCLELLILESSNRDCSLLSENPRRFSAISQILPLLLKCSDISNPGKPSPVYLSWTRRVILEMRGQHAYIAPSKPLPISQIEFIRNIALPVMCTTKDSLELDALRVLKATCEKHLSIWLGLADI